MNVAGIVLAAGGSSRLGRPKQLLLHRGRPLVRLAAEEAIASTCDRVIVVLGAAEAAIRPALAGLDVTIVTNPLWAEGMGSSIRSGVALAASQGCSAALLMLCDQPALDAAHLDALLDAHRHSGGVVASRYDDVLGVPAVFDQSTFADLLALQGAEGAKKVLRRAREVTAIDWPQGAEDIDTPEDAARLI